MFLPAGLLLLAVAPSHSHHDGAPSCLAVPNHGARRKPLKLDVTRTSDRKWQIKIKEKHRGLVLSTRAGGLWWGHVPGYGDKGPCITHTDNNSKQQQTFVFRTHRDETPEFTGYIVFDYRSYAPLEADTKNYLDLSGRANNTALTARFLARFGLELEDTRNNNTDPYYGHNNSFQRNKDFGNFGDGHNSLGRGGYHGFYRNGYGGNRDGYSNRGQGDGTNTGSYDDGYYTGSFNSNRGVGRRHNYYRSDDFNYSFNSSFLG